MRTVWINSKLEEYEYYIQATEANIPSLSLIWTRSSLLLMIPRVAAEIATRITANTYSQRKTYIIIHGFIRYTSTLYLQLPQREGKFRKGPCLIIYETVATYNYSDPVPRLLNTSCWRRAHHILRCCKQCVGRYAKIIFLGTEVINARLHPLTQETFPPVLETDCVYNRLVYIPIEMSTVALYISCTFGVYVVSQV